MSIVVRIWCAFLVFTSSCSNQQIKHNGKLSIPEFVDITDSLGLAGVKGGHFSWCDYNDDGFVDLLVERVGLFKNGGPDSKWSFANFTQDVGLDPQKCFGVWGDYNNDGWPDIISNSGILWKNKDGKSFVNFTEESKLKIQNSRTVSWVDYDNDGYADIYVATREGKKGEKWEYYPHQMWRNLGDGTFKDVSEDLGVNKSTYGRSVVSCDYDNDGKQEIYVGNYRLKPNFLWKFQDGKMIDIAKDVNAAGDYEPEKYSDEHTKHKWGPSYGHTIGCAWTDFNNDGYFDLWVSNLAHKYVGPSKLKGIDYDTRGYTNDDSKIYINQGAPKFNFIDSREKSGIPKRPIGGKDVYKGDELWSGVACADFDNDGFVDVFVPQIYNLQYAHSLLFRNKGNLTFEDVTDRLGIKLLDSYGCAWADFNNDGFIDLVIHGRDKVDGQHSVRLFMNKGNGNSWIKFKLIGKKSNKMALGAVVRIRSGNQIQVRQVEGGTGSHSQQNSQIAHFGIGGAKMIDEVQVRWSSGNVTKKSDLKSCNLYTLYED